MKNKELDIKTIGSKIHTIRGHRVMLDRDLAELYGVKAKVLNQAVKRKLRSQTVTPNISMKTRLKPQACTHEGVAMLSSILTSTKAIQITKFKEPQ